MDIFLWLYLHYTTATKMGSKHLMYLWKVLEALKDTVLHGISLMRPLEKKKLLHQHSLYLYHVFLERANACEAGLEQGVKSLPVFLLAR